MRYVINAWGGPRGQQGKIAGTRVQVHLASCTHNAFIAIHISFATAFANICEERWHSAFAHAPQHKAGSANDLHADKAVAVLSAIAAVLSAAVSLSSSRSPLSA